MRPTMILFKNGLKQISRDGMLMVLILAPFLVGAFFKFAVPFIDTILTMRLSFSLTPWYGLIDGMLMCLPPMFVAMAAAFLLLEERDEGLGAFYPITPVGGYAYLLARIGLPMLGAFVITVIVTSIFDLSSLSIGVILSGSLISSFTGISLAMMVVSMAGNRVEGLALSKLMGISFIGLFSIWFVPAPYRCLLAVLPSFWIGKLLTGGAAFWPFLIGLLSCFLWIAVFTRSFLKRV